MNLNKSLIHLWNAKSWLRWSGSFENLSSMPGIWVQWRPWGRFSPRAPPASFLRSSLTPIFDLGKVSHGPKVQSQHSSGLSGNSLRCCKDESWVILLQQSFSVCRTFSLAGIRCLISKQKQNMRSVFGLGAQRTKKQTSSKTGVHIFCLGLFYWEFLNLTADKCSVKLNRVKG